MADAGLHFEVDGQGELQAVSDALAAEEQRIGDDLLQAIRQGAQELRQRAQEAVLGEPIHAAKQTGLRARIAAGTSVEDADDGASVVASLDGEDAPLPADMDSGAWSHPVFGNRNVWVTQSGYYAWFSNTMDDGEDELENAEESVLDEAINRIAEA